MKVFVERGNTLGHFKKNLGLSLVKFTDPEWSIIYTG